MFPRVPKLMRLLISTCLYMYCLLLLYNLRETGQELNAKQKKALEREFEARNTHIKAMCVAHPLPPSKMEMQARDASHVSPDLANYFHNLHLKAALKNLVYLPHQNLTWCLVAKVASTSMSRALLELESPLHQRIELPVQVKLKNTFRPVEISRVNQTIGSSRKFLFVRHPFQRLVSAYRNKLENSYLYEDGQYFYKTYGRHIVERFRTRGTGHESKGERREVEEQKHHLKDENRNESLVLNEDIRDDFINVEESVGLPVRRRELEDLEETIVHLEEKNPEKQQSVKEREEIKYRREPTFLEYVEYLLHTDPSEYDEHWKPITLHCHICSFHYDYIIKYENFKEETRYLVQLLQETGSLPKIFQMEWKNKGGTDDKMVSKYMDQISENKRKQLYNKYRHDFLYFGYTE